MYIFFRKIRAMTICRRDENIHFKNITKQENRNPRDNERERLAQMFRDYVQRRYEISSAVFEKLEKLGSPVTPEGIIRSEIKLQIAKGGRQTDFWFPVLRAWDTIAYDRYTPGSSDEMAAGSNLSKARIYGKTPTVKFTYPEQILTLDALAEAFNIPHEPGRSEITIPEYLRNYKQWSLTQEYKDRVAQAKANKKK